MGLWSDQVVPRVVNATLDVAEVRELRSRICRDLSGDVVEVGFGSGLNIPHYPSTVAGVWAVEPSEVSWRLAQPRIAGCGASVQRAGLDGAALDLPDDRFDAALSTFTFCTIPRLDVALAEIMRVLRPGGRLYFLEHGRSPDEHVARWQDRLQPIWGRVTAGCHLTRPIADHVQRSGMQVEELETFYARGATPFSYVSLGWCWKP